MRQVFTFLSLIVIFLSSGAITVNNSSGHLRDKVADHKITSLTVTGTMNALDFQFIADDLNALTEVDLTGVKIEAYDNNGTPLLGDEVMFDADAIPALSFFGKPLTTVKLPRELKAIGLGAFAGCKSLRSVMLSTGLTSIGAYAFSGSGLTQISVPASVVEMGGGAFSRCAGLTTAVVEGAVLGDYAFLGCSKLSDVTLGSALVKIGTSAFNGCSALHAVKLGNGKVKTIGAEAFILSGLNEFDMSKMNQLETIGDFAFLNLKSIETLTVPESVTFIGTRAMAGMTGLKSIYALPDLVPALGDSVWAGVNQPAVDLISFYANDYAAADQWREFNIHGAVLLGDVNKDGIVNVSDITCLINHILQIPDEPFDEVAADVLSDGKINVSDVTQLINLILTSTTVIVKKAGEVNTSDLVLIDDLAIAPGETRTIDIRLNNEQRYAAMQADVVLPAGLRFVDGTLKQTSRLGQHSVISQETDGTLRVIAYSLQNGLIAEGNDVIATVEVTADRALATDAQINVCNVVFATEKSRTYFADDSRARVMNTTGVNDLSEAGHKVYAIAGAIVVEAANDARAQLVSMNGMSQDVRVTQGRNVIDIAPGIYILRIDGKSFKLSVK